MCRLLSCGRLLSAEQLAVHRHNLVVHESALPQGQGWSPMNWQILEGASRIPITLSEATADLDAGPIFLQQEIVLQGHELVDEWRALQAQATLELCLAWFDRYREVVAAAQPQHGEARHYRRRRRPIPSWIPSAPWQSNSSCCGLWTTSAIRPSSTGAAGALCCRCSPSPYDPLSPWQPTRHVGLHRRARSRPSGIGGG